MRGRSNGFEPPLRQTLRQGLQNAAQPMTFSEMHRRWGRGYGSEYVYRILDVMRTRNELVPQGTTRNPITGRRETLYVLQQARTA